MYAMEIFSSFIIVILSILHFIKLRPLRLLIVLVSLSDSSSNNLPMPILLCKLLTAACPTHTDSDSGVGGSGDGYDHQSLEGTHHVSAVQTGSSSPSHGAAA